MPFDAALAWPVVHAWLGSAWPAVPAWPVLGSLAGGVGALGLAWAIRRHRGRPGVDWFLGVFAAQATWCLSYGVGLLVEGPTLRTVLEATTWLGIVWTGVAFLGFALAYTGRADVIRGRLFAAIVGFGLLSTLVLATNPIHGGFWTGFRSDPVLGVETVSYALGPWAYLVVAVESVLVASAVFLLVDTLFSYGPLYRRETAAVALSSLPPGFALVAWTLGVGPVPQLRLAPLMFVPHVLLDAYAFDRAEMFDRHPTTSRAAERTAIDDLADPIIALALDRRIVRLNPAAETLLEVDAEDARDRPLSAFLDVPVDGERGEDESDDANETVAVETADGRRTYAVSTSRLTDPNGSHVGYTVVLSDVTERERRRQQLEVLNRVLRHNLRN
ncbi:histidine kinase N-terminal 7TM domain-containing protein, partial [Halorubrum halodurans]